MEAERGQRLPAGEGQVLCGERGLGGRLNETVDPLDLEGDGELAMSMDTTALELLLRGLDEVTIQFKSTSSAYPSGASARAVRNEVVHKCEVDRLAVGDCHVLRTRQAGW